MRSLMVHLIKWKMKIVKIMVMEIMMTKILMKELTMKFMMEKTMNRMKKKKMVSSRTWMRRLSGRSSIRECAPGRS